MDFRKWKFKSRINTKSCGEARNKSTPLGAGNWPPQVPVRGGDLRRIDVFIPRASLGTIRNESSGACESGQGHSFIPRSSLRPFSGRVAHHSECPPCSVEFHALCHARLTNCPRRTPHKQTQFSMFADKQQKTGHRRSRKGSSRPGAQPGPSHGVVERQRVASIRGQKGRRSQPISFGRRQSDAERGVGSDQAPDIQGRVGGKCRVISLAVKASRAWRNELKAPDEAKDVICKGRLEMLGKSHLTLPKASLIKARTGQEF
jgi:hypothetical protein